MKEDGIYGPKTHLAMTKAVARLGAGRVREAIALGEFSQFARQVQRGGPADGLNNAASKAFGGLFPQGRGGEASRLVAESLQDSLNEEGPRHFGDWTPLKVDGVIGPKTSAAFSRAVRKTGARTFSQRFGSHLGFL